MEARIVTYLRLLRTAPVHTAAELISAKATPVAVDEDAARLRLAVKAQDDFFTTYAVSSWSPILTKAAARLGLSPSAVTGLSSVLAVLAALAFWHASRPAMIGGAILLYFAFVLDCVDGQLARYTRTFSAFGGWLDTMADRAKEYAVYAGLAAGAERVGLANAWPVAVAAMLLQTVRHLTDTWYGALHDEAVRSPTLFAGSGSRSPSDASGPIGRGVRGVGARLSAVSTRVQGERGSAAYWLKRIVVFPIGERWALLAVLAAVSNGRFALVVLLGCAGGAAAYTLVLRSIRALSMRIGVLNTVDTGRQRDDGILVRLVLGRAGLAKPLVFATMAAAAPLALVSALLTGWVPGSAQSLSAVTAALVLAAGLAARDRHAGPLDWLVPAALRAAEYLFVVAVALLAAVPTPVTFLLLFTLAIRHYDLTAGAGTGAAVVGWEGRVVVLGIAGLAGFATVGAAVLAGCVGGFFLFSAASRWATVGQAR